MTPIYRNENRFARVLKNIALFLGVCTLTATATVVGATAYIMLANLQIFLPGSSHDMTPKIIYDRIEPDATASERSDRP